MRFVDEIDVAIASGKGGDGCVSFHRAKFVPRGGPNGGDGGRGGALVFEATPQRNTLVDYRRNQRYSARNGQPGMGNNKTGAAGEDLVLLVPVGTVITDRNTGEVLADLDREGAQWVMPGGRGGLGNTHFATAQRRTPLFAQDGEEGSEREITMELKLIAEVGLLGYPNAGKSTLLSRISAARPKVASYPFTTLTPSLGVVQLGPGNSFVVADIPGLVDGASEGVGLGHRFLKHLERCALFLHLVSPEEWGGTPTERILALNRELAAYDEELAQRKQLIVLTKIDTLSEAERRHHREALEALGVGPVVELSAVSGAGLDELVRQLWPVVQKHREDERETQPAPSPPHD
ncbi:MAG: GTPase ObgE [Deltaproteobacteria bacterium]|nr:GTPase ObgE [Deltaproteobacteria bacterium]